MWSLRHLDCQTDLPSAIPGACTSATCVRSPPPADERQTLRNSASWPTASVSTTETPAARDTCSPQIRARAAPARARGDREKSLDLGRVSCFETKRLAKFRRSMRKIPHASPGSEPNARILFIFLLALLVRQRDHRVLEGHFFAYSGMFVGTRRDDCLGRSVAKGRHASHRHICA